MTRSAKDQLRNIHDIILIYSNSKGDDIAQVMQKLNGAILECQTPGKFKVKPLQQAGGAEILTAIFTDLVRAWPSRGKNKAAQELLQFAHFLRTEHQIRLDETMLPRDIPNVTERRLDMLKFLQIPRTMAELEIRYLTSDRTLRGDLNALVDGWELLGNQIKIKRIDMDGKISYNSTVHPVLLPLNLTEVYSLAAGFPNLARETVYEEISQYLARAVCYQLSDYAVDIISRSAPQLPLKIADDDGKAYRQEKTMLESSRISWLIYMAKQCQRCRVTYVTRDSEILYAEGVPSLGHDDLSCIGFYESALLIPLSDIITIEPMDPYL